MIYRLSHLFLIRAVLFIGTMILIQPSQALTVRPLSFAHITEQSGTIVHGIVTRVDSSRDEATGMICTLTTVRIIDDITGGNESHLTFKQLGGVDKKSGTTWLTRSTVIEPGQEILLCLYKPSKLGFRTPVGRTQGVFYISTKSASQEKIVDNGMPTKILFPPLVETKTTPKAKTRSTLIQNHEALEQCKSMKLRDVKQGLRDYVSQNKSSANSRNSKKHARLLP